MEAALLIKVRFERSHPSGRPNRGGSNLKKTLSLISLAGLSLIPVGALRAQTLSVSPTSVTANALAGSTTVVTQTIAVSTTSGNPQYVAQTSLSNWLSLAQTPNDTAVTGTAPGSFTIYMNPSNLSAQTYTANITVSGGAGPAIVIPVSFTVSTIGISPQPPVQLNYLQNSGSFPSQALQLNANTFTQYSTQIPSTSNCTWLFLVPSSGTAPGTLTVELNGSVVVILSPNTYSCTFTITPANSTGNPISVPVNLTVSNSPTVTVSPSSVSMNYQIGFTVPSQVLTLTSNATQSVSYTVGFATTDAGYTGNPWATLNKTGGTLQPPANSDSVTLSYNSSVPLPQGTYHGAVTVVVNNVSQTIPVQLLVSNSPLINLSPSSLTFTAQLNGAAPANQIVTATSTSGTIPINLGSISYTNGSGWLFASGSGTATSSGTPITVSVNPTGLTLGTYKASVQVQGSGASNSPLTISVTLTIANDALITTNVSTTAPLIFPFQTGLTATSPAPQNITVSSSTGTTLNYSATAAVNTVTGCGSSWLSLSGATTGSTSATFTAAANPTGIVPGTAGVTCTGTITITATNPTTGNAAPNSPYTIPVSLYVSANALLVVSPATAPAFTATVGSSTSSAIAQNCTTNGTASCNISLSNTSPTDQLTVRVDFSTTDGTNWLVATPSSGTIALNGNILLGIGLFFVPPTPGSYSGVVKITATDAGNLGVLDSPVMIPVTLQVTAGAPTASPTSLSFSQTLGGNLPATQTINVGSSTGQALNFTAAASGSASATWLSVSPTSGTTPATITVSVDGTKLTPSATPYQGTITITGAGSANVVTVPVTLTLNAGTIAATPTALTFSQVQGGAAPAAQTVNVTGTPGALSFTTSATTSTGGSWLTATPASGATPGAVQVSVNSGSLGAGQYTGTVAIASAGATGSPITVTVTLTVVPPQSLAASPSTLTFAAIANQPAPNAQTVSLTSSGSGVPFTLAATTQSGGNWLSVSPTSGVTPAQLTVSVASQSLAAGNYTGAITISSPNSTTPVTVTVNLAVSAIPTPVITAVKNAASYSVGAVSPGENVFITGTGIGPATLTLGALTAAGNLATTIANTTVLFDNIPAPVIYVSATQTSVMVPYEIGGRPTTNLTIVYQGATSAAVAYTVAASQPGIYTQNSQGSGPGSILNQNLGVNGPGAPAAAGSVIAVYMTGEGATTPPSTTGGVAAINGNGLNHPNLTVTATVGGLPATVTYAGSAPDIVYGVMQVNLTVPPSLTTSGGPAVAQPIVITLTNPSTGQTVSTQTGVTVTVQ